MGLDTSIDWLNVLGIILLRIAAGVAILLAGRWLAGVVRNWTHSALRRSHAPPSLAATLERAMYFGALLGMAVAVLIVLGVPSQVPIFVVGVMLILAVVALRETLRDFAATLIIIMFRPFGVADQIETNGVVGEVEEISMFHTVLISLENRKVIIPNGLIQNSSLINYSALDKTRLDVAVRVSYADNILTAKNTLLEVAKADIRVLPQPAAWVDVMELGENGIELVLRVFARPGDIWALRPALNEQIKLAFDRCGLTIPVPQLQLLNRIQD